MLFNFLCNQLWCFFTICEDNLVRATDRVCHSVGSYLKQTIGELVGVQSLTDGAGFAYNLVSMQPR